MSGSSKRLYPARKEASSKALLKFHPTNAEVAHLAVNFTDEPDVVLAIRGASHVQEMLKACIKSKFRELEPEDERMLFDGGSNGIISGFSAQIRLAFAMMIIDFDTYADLMLLNTIRNVFAHSQHPVTFTNKYISKDCMKLKLYNMTLKAQWSWKEEKNKEPQFSVYRATYHNSIFLYYHQFDLFIKGKTILSASEFGDYIMTLPRSPYQTMK